MLKSIAALTVLFLVGCDAAKADYGKCVALEAKDPEAALVACETAFRKASGTASGKAAASKIESLKAVVAEIRQKRADEAEKARIAKEKEDLARWRSIPAGIDMKIREQALRDMSRGAATRVIDMIATDAGQPVRAYEAAFGAQVIYVWGADPGESASRNAIENAPFAVRMPRDLSCGDYTRSMVEFYSQGQRL